MARVHIVDYTLGNMHSVARAFEHLEAEVCFVHEPGELESAERLVLPGVGAFGDGMRALHAAGFVAPLQEYAVSGRPLLGICLGMQMLLDASEEFGVSQGLGIIPGRVVPIPGEGADGTPHKIPHIGWNELRVPPSRRDWSESVLAGTKAGAAVYFVHSFMAVPEDPAHRLADCDYDGVAVSAAVQHGHVYGCQFHPEKSGENGLEIIRRFLAL